MIEISSVSKTFHAPAGPVKALDGVSFSVAEGRTCLLSGPNGSGKTTLLKALCGLVLPDSGTVSVGGSPVCLGATGRMTGWMPGGEPGFYGRLTLEENLVFFAAIHGLRRRESGRRIRDLSARLCLENFLGTPVQQLSSGTARRAALARAVLHEPGVLLLDEPFRSLDPDSSAIVRTFLHSLGGVTMLLASAEKDAGGFFCGLIAALRDGRLESFGPSDSRN
ncbi:MAG: ABC transporter ATP-binding protein [bacterium]